jgi:hypothetical protein
MITIFLTSIYIKMKMKMKRYTNMENNNEKCSPMSEIYEIIVKQLTQQLKDTPGMTRDEYLKASIELLKKYE